MPKASQRPLRRAHRAQAAQLLPRRLSNEEAREKYRREKMKPAGPIDNWLCASSSVFDDSEGALGHDEVRCIVTVQVTEAVVRCHSLLVLCD